MKKIYFKKSGDNFDYLLLAILFIIIFIFGFFIKNNVELSKFNLLLIFLVAFYKYGTPFFYKNYVALNNDSTLYLKFEKFWYNIVEFSDIENYTFNNGILHIVRKRWNELEFDLSGYRQDDVEKLLKILENHKK